MNFEEMYARQRRMLRVLGERTSPRVNASDSTGTCPIDKFRLILKVEILNNLRTEEMKKLEEKIRSLKFDGLEWGNFELLPPADRKSFLKVEAVLEEADVSIVDVKYEILRISEVLGVDYGTFVHHGLVVHRTLANQRNFSPPVAIAYYDKNSEGTNYWRNQILEVAKEFKGQMTFAISEKKSFARELTEFGLDSESDEPVVAARDSERRKFRMTDPFSVENLKKFIKNVIDGNLKPRITSEPLPESNDGPVKVAVADNFDYLVIEADADTLIQFYHPRCDASYRLAPTYEELGTKLAGENGVQIVKMDAIANDVPPNFKVNTLSQNSTATSFSRIFTDFPVIFWIPRDDKENPKQYVDGREVDDFVKYIAKHATKELDGFDRNGNPKTKEQS